jgi:hypothetical protein
MDGSVDVLTTVLQLCRPAIVDATKQAQVARLRATTLAARMAMIEFQPGPFLALHAVRANPAAAQAVALDDGTACRT